MKNRVAARWLARQAAGFYIGVDTLFRVSAHRYGPWKQGEYLKIVEDYGNSVLVKSPSGKEKVIKKNDLKRHALDDLHPLIYHVGQYDFLYPEASRATRSVK